MMEKGSCAACFLVVKERGVKDNVESAWCACIIFWEEAEGILQNKGDLTTLKQMLNARKDGKTGA